MSSQTVDFANQTDTEIDTGRWPQVLRQILHDHRFHDYRISVAIVDDPTIHALNRQYLNHDYPTDVLSFVLDSDTEQGKLEGEVIVSLDTARRTAIELQAAWEDELLLYVIHGMLHLVGFDDHQADQTKRMRAAEQRYMRSAGAGAHPIEMVQDAPE